MKALLSLFGGLAIIGVASQLPAQASSPPDTGRAARGRAIFEAVGCSGCHGIAGQGGLGPMTGPRIAGVPAEALLAIVRQPPPPMPPYSATVLPDEKVQEIADYLASVAAPNRAEDIPLLAPRKITGTSAPRRGGKAD